MRAKPVVERDATLIAKHKSNGTPAASGTRQPAVGQAGAAEAAATAT
ncbi:MAG: hypothetical protein U0792_04635 [Gemmataceae bacterium]